MKGSSCSLVAVKQPKKAQIYYQVAEYSNETPEYSNETPIYSNETPEYSN